MTTTDGSGAAGQMYTLVCRVAVQNGLVNLPLTQWLHPNSSVLRSEETTDLNYIFVAIRASAGGQYTCRSTINIPEVGVTNLSASSSIDVTVEGIV